MAETTNGRMRVTSFVVTQKLATKYKRSQADVIEALTRLGDKRRDLLEVELRGVTTIVGQGRRKTKQAAGTDPGEAETEGFSPSPPDDSNGPQDEKDTT